MRRSWMVGAVLALGVAGCADTADLVPTNGVAQAAGTPKLYFFRGFGGGPMKIVMPSGETLPGTFSISESPAAVVPGGPGNFEATARGPSTRLVCHGTLIAGHGAADCTGLDGAVYHVVL